jgi:two-component system response regulator YesN
MIKLLIADDERTIREGIAHSIDWESLGISRVFLAADGREAWELIEREQPDIVIIDIVMPEMTGIEVIAKFDGLANRPEFVIISGHDEFQFAQEAIRYHVNNYILKPCTPQEIMTTIKEVIDKIEQRQSMDRYLEMLLPQAREQILHNFLLETGSGSDDLLEHVFDKRHALYQILVFTFEDPADFVNLPELKISLNSAAVVLNWSICTIIHDCVVLIFDAASESRIRELLKAVYSSLAEGRITGVKAVVTEKGGLCQLPRLFREALEARRLGCASSELIPLIDTCRLRYSEPVRRAVQYINEHYSDPSLSLNHIASNLLFLNPDYFGKLFKKECGVKFNDYLTMLRIEKAKQLIARSEDLKIYEVADKVGFGSSTAYFSRTFRKYTGMLPSEYKERFYSSGDQGA